MMWNGKSKYQKTTWNTISLSQSSNTDKTKQYIYAQIYVISKLYSLKSKETISIKLNILFTSWGRQRIMGYSLIDVSEW